jgi:hypothetical protein
MQLLDYYIKKKYTLNMSKITSLNVQRFFMKDQKAWDDLWTKNSDYSKGEIISCCTSHALEQLVLSIDPKNAHSHTSMINVIKPVLNLHIIQAMEIWECDDFEHNEDIQKILDIARTEMKN